MKPSIQEYAKRLRLPYLKNNHELLVSESMDKQHSYEQFLTAVLETELIERDKNAVTRKIKAARFPYNKYLSDLKYDSFPLDVSNRVRELQSLSFIEKGQNIILVGNPGVGKTHIAIGLGTLACTQNKTVLFITVPNLSHQPPLQVVVCH